MFGFSLKDGADLPGWPIDVADALQRSGRHFDPNVQNERSPLTLVNDTVYVAFSGVKTSATILRRRIGRRSTLVMPISEAPIRFLSTFLAQAAPRP